MDIKHKMNKSSTLAHLKIALLFLTLGALFGCGIDKSAIISTDDSKVNINGTDKLSIVQTLKDNEHLSIEEGIALYHRLKKESPDAYNFEGGKESIRRQIGMAVPVLAAEKIMTSVKKSMKKNNKQITYHHDWMIKAKGKDLYFTGKEELDDQMSFKF